MDPNNPVVKLCVEGMEREGRGDVTGAAKHFEQAWAQSTNDFERCIAAHYVARHQPSHDLAFDWNQVAMDCAGRVSDNRVAGFLPSLCLNLGKSHEDLGNQAEARRLYQRAADALITLPPGSYRDIVQNGIDRGVGRIGDSGQSGPSQAGSDHLRP